MTMKKNKNPAKQSEFEKRGGSLLVLHQSLYSLSRRHTIFEPSETKNTRVTINLVMSCRRYEFQSDAVNKRVINYSRGLVQPRSCMVTAYASSDSKRAKLSILNCSLGNKKQLIVTKSMSCELSTWLLAIRDGRKVNNLDSFIATHKANLLPCRGRKKRRSALSVDSKVKLAARTMLFFLLNYFRYSKLLELDHAEHRISSNLLKGKQSSRKTCIVCCRL